MRTYAIAHFVFGLLLCAAYREGDSPPHRHVAALPSWMAGCWAARTSSDTLEEYWTVPRARVMLGISRLVHNDSLVSYEQNRIEIRGTSLAFVSKVLNGPDEEYLLVDQGLDVIVFETSGKAVNERIRYRREANTLRVRFARRTEKEEQGVESTMMRVSCDGQPSISASRIASVANTSRLWLAGY